MFCFSLFTVWFLYPADNSNQVSLVFENIYPYICTCVYIYTHTETQSFSQQREYAAAGGLRWLDYSLEKVLGSLSRVYVENA